MNYIKNNWTTPFFRINIPIKNPPTQQNER